MTLTLNSRDELFAALNALRQFVDNADEDTTDPEVAAAELLAERLEAAVEKATSAK